MALAHCEKETIEKAELEIGCILQAIFELQCLREV